MNDMWVVRGVSAEARKWAKVGAAEAGQTLGAWVTEAIEQKGDMQRVLGAPKNRENQGKEAGVAMSGQSGSRAVREILKQDDVIAEQGPLGLGEAFAIAKESVSREFPGPIPKITRKALRTMKKQLMGPDAMPRKRELCQHGFYEGSCPKGCR